MAQRPNRIPLRTQPQEVVAVAADLGDRGEKKKDKPKDADEDLQKMTKAQLYEEAKKKGLDVKWIGSTNESLRKAIKEKRIAMRAEEKEKDKPEIQYGVALQEPNNLEMQYVNVDMTPYPQNLIEVQADDAVFKNIVREAFTHIVENSNANTKDAVKYQIVMMSKDGKSVFATPFSQETDEILRDIMKKIDDFANRYDARYDTPVEVSMMRVRMAKGFGEQIKGMARSMSTANETWYVVDSSTRKNCVYVAIETSLKYRERPELLFDEQKRFKAGENAKSRLKGSIDAPTLRELEDVAQAYQIHLCVYNNIFEKIVEHKFGERFVEIQVVNAHAKALIRKDRLDIIVRERLATHIEKLNECFRKTEEQSTPQKIKPVAKHPTRDTKYICWDIETYTIACENRSGQRGGDKKLVPYCSGLTWRRDGVIETHQWYTDENNLKHFAKWLKDNIEDIKHHTLYAHNGGKFDLTFLIRDVFAVDRDFEILPNKMVELGGSLIGFGVKYKGVELLFKDSYRLFQSGLKAVTRDLGVESMKTEFDHTKMSPETYMLHRDECLAYHKIDCEGLFQCIDKMSQMVHEAQQINITKCFTAASLSKKILLSGYLPLNAYTNSIQVDRYVRMAYQGGRCEAFRIGTFLNQYYYDVTSLYPYVGTKRLPIGIAVMHETLPADINKALELIKFGFIRVRVRGTKEMLKCSKPLHGLQRDGKFLFPYFDTPTELTLFTAEIRLGLIYGYTYEALDGVSYEQTTEIGGFFKDGFEHKAKAKAEGKKALEFMWKIIINSGYGIWGYNPHDKDTLKLYSGNGWLEPFNNNRLIAMGRLADKTLVRLHNDAHSKDTNVAIAAAITSYARMHLHDIFEAIASVGGTVIYCDTDSIICDIDLSAHPEIAKKLRPDGVGATLGGLKNELGMLHGRDLPFQKVTIVGCKSYRCEGLRADGSTLTMEKLKGYQKTTDVVIERIANGEIITQTQEQLQINKNDLLRDGTSFEMRVATVVKRFRAGYNKGIVTDGIVEPFTL
jgi:hypothetical protein